MFKGVFVTVIPSSAWMRVKAYPCADVYHWGQRACCVYISGFRMAMFGKGKAAVGKEFYWITYFPILVSNLFTSVKLLRAFCLPHKIQNNCCLSVMSMSLPALGCVWPSYFLSYSFQRWALKMLLQMSGQSPLGGSLKGMQFVIWNEICKSGMAFSTFLWRKLLSSCFL